MKYKSVTWYSRDGLNEHIKPFARVVFVESDDPNDARTKVDRELERLYEQAGESVDLLATFLAAQL